MTAPYSRFLEAPRTGYPVDGGALPQPKRGLYRNGLKRFTDVSLVLLAAPMILPIVLILALIIWRQGGQPFYAQRRIGKGGRVFRMWKLRSMVVNADDLIASYLASNAEARAEWERTQKLRNDPRISDFGRFLRKSSLDELPQLWNVLRGDMSIVGPRPMMENQRTLYPGTGYYMVRPGLTGYWQVTERNHSSFVERATYDDQYEAELSLPNDARVLVKTVSAVLKGTGV